MKTFFKVLFWIFFFPIMIVWVLFKGLLGLANDMERGRKRRSRHIGVMSSPSRNRKRSR